MSRMVIKGIALVLLMAAVCEVSALSAGSVERRARSHASVAAVHKHRDEEKRDHEDVLDEEKREQEVLKGLKERQQHDLNLGHRAVVSLGAAEVRKSLATSALLRTVRESVDPMFWHLFWSGCSYVLNATIAALIYRHFIWQNADDDIEALLLEQKEKEGFEYAMFSGEQCNLQLGLCSVFCLCIRWPATVSDARLKLLAFWPAFFIFACLEGFTGLLCGLLWMVQVGVCIWARQKIRAHYGLPTAGATYIEDCLAWGCCCWFAVAQEAKQMMHVKAHDSVA